MFFAGPPDTSFNFSVTEDTPSPRNKKIFFQKKYKPRDSGVVLSDEEDGRYFGVMPKASTSIGSLYSSGDEGLVTPGTGPSPGSGWPQAAVVVSSFFDEMSEGVLDGNAGAGEGNVDEFILRTLAAGAKGTHDGEGPKKIPGTPVKKVRTSYMGGERPWQSAVTRKVGWGFELGGGRNVPRKSLPAAFPGWDKRGVGTDSDSDEEIISPSLRKEQNMQQGSKELTALPRSRWLVRRSSSGAISSGSESLLGTPTGLGGQGELFYF
jgi:mitosis inhibitor protein kinase SWE1